MLFDIIIVLIISPKKNLMKGKVMIDLEAMKTKISDGKIDSYVESYLVISDKLDTLENELRQGNLEAEKNDEILEMYDSLMEKIANYYIENHYMKK
jgi:hypothetical protein